MEGFFCIASKHTRKPAACRVRRWWAKVYGRLFFLTVFIPLSQYPTIPISRVSPLTTETKFLTIESQLMFNTLQPTSLIAYRNERKKNKMVSKPAVIISINAETQINLVKNPEQLDTNALPFGEWNMPEQAEGYLKGSVHDFL